MSVRQQPPSAKGAPRASLVAARMIVARFQDGRMIKGTTHDFSPGKAAFHVHEGGDERTPAVEVHMEHLKAVFYVRSYQGEKDYNEVYDFTKLDGQGKKVLLMFQDGEVIAGETMAYDPSRSGFFLIPADPASNNVRIYVIAKAVKKLEWLDDRSGTPVPTTKPQLR